MLDGQLAGGDHTLGLVADVEQDLVALHADDRATYEVPVIEFGSVGDKVMFIEESFIAEDNQLNSNVIMFAEMETIKTIMERLGIEG